MSGDVQPRKRRDKKRKRDDDEVKEVHHGVHATKMGAEDMLLHVQGEHDTGGHWCAKIFFFSLLAILFGLVGLIIMEHRGLADLDTPVAESRFSNYFEGWVDDQHDDHHDEHDVLAASLEEHEHDDEPFEEEEDHSEVDSEAEEEHDADEEHDAEETVEEADEEDEETPEDEDQTQEDEENEEDEEHEADENVTAEDTEDENRTQEDENEEEQNVTAEEAEEAENQTQEDDEEEEEEVIKDNEGDNEEAEQDNTGDDEQQETRAYGNEDEADDDTFDEEEDDGTFESIENVVDNDAEELLLLQEKARQQAKEAKVEEPAQDDEETSYSSPLAVKFGIGVALALVARFVLIRKKPNTCEDEPSPEVLMRRRLTIAAPEDIPDEAPSDEAPPLEDEEVLDEEEYSEEEIEIEEEIIVYEDDEPNTFEQFEAMYRPSGDDSNRSKLETQRQEPSPQKAPEPAKPKANLDDFRPKFEEIRPRKIEPEKSEILAKRQALQMAASPPSFKSEPVKPPPSREEELVDYSGDEEEIEYDDEEEEEMYEEEEEEEIGDEAISDSDDTELMQRLEAKYGRLPQREYDSEDEDVDDATWTKIKPRSGGGPQSSSENEFLEEELRRANAEMLRENATAALQIYESLSLNHPDSPEVFYGKAKALDRLSELEQSNQLLNEAIQAYKRFLAFEEYLKDGDLKKGAERCINRMRFMGHHMQAIPIHEMLIKRFNDEPYYRNQLAITYLLSSRLSEAKHVLHDTLLRWRHDGVALVHYGFVLKTLDKNYELAAKYLREGIETDAEGTQDGRFYFNLGEALQRLNRTEEAMEIYRRGAEKKIFLSEYQRSLYNVNNLKAQPFWTKEETTYEKYLHTLEMNWPRIRDEGLSVLNDKGYFVDEAENLKDSGNWQQLELFARGYKNKKNCDRAPLTCGIIEMFPAARFCKRGQVKFSVMHPGTHVWPHCGPTNCRLRAHLGLIVPPGTKLRVAKEERTWLEGEFLIFDDSFEHEVWHNGTSLRLVLIVDVWHPDLTETQRSSLSAI